MCVKEGEAEALHRTRLDRSKYGLKVAAILGAVCAAEGLLISEGVLNYKDPKVIVPAVATVAAASGAGRWLGGKLKSKKTEEESKPNYDLSPEELKSLETELVDDVDKISKEGKFKHKKPGFYAVWLASDNKYTNILRTNEAGYFPEVKELTDDVEDETTFLAMVDTRKETRRVVHATTVSGISKDPEKLRNEGKSGFITIDELIDLGNFTAAEFQQYYNDHNIDVQSSIAVDTNFRVGKVSEGVDGLQTADLAYLAVFQLGSRQETGENENAIFASINRHTIISFRRLGLQVEPLMGRDDLITPESKHGKNFFPVMIPYNKHNVDLFKAMNYVVPEISLT
jgi:hypothetical protein